MAAEQVLFSGLRLWGLRHRLYRLSGGLGLRIQGLGLGACRDLRAKGLRPPKLAWKPQRIPTQVPGSFFDLGVSMIRILAFGGLYWGPLISGNYHMEAVLDSVLNKGSGFSTELFS